MLQRSATCCNAAQHVATQRNMPTWYWGALGAVRVCECACVRAQCANSAFRVDHFLDFGSILRARTLICTRALTHVHTHIHTRTLIHTRTHAHAHARTRARTHTRTHAHAHARAHACAGTSARRGSATGNSARSRRSKWATAGCRCASGASQPGTACSASHSVQCRVQCRVTKARPLRCRVLWLPHSTIEVHCALATCPQCAMLQRSSAAVGTRSLARSATAQPRCAAGLCQVAHASVRHRVRVHRG
jgi:hypothetical protein